MTTAVPLLNPSLSVFRCSGNDAPSDQALKSSLLAAISNSPYAKTTTYDLSSHLPTCVRQADGFFLLRSDVGHANLTLDVAVAGFCLRERTLSVTFAFTLAPRHRAITVLFSMLVQDPWVLSGEFDVIELLVPTYRPTVAFDWLTGVANTYGFSYRDTPDDSCRVFRTNVLRFNTRPAKSVGSCDAVLRFTPQELMSEPNLVRSLGTFVSQKGGPAARAFRLWLIENGHLTEEEADEKTLFTVRVTALGEGQMTAPDGLHADFPDTDDEGLFRSTLEGATPEFDGQHFLVLSGPPATQFFQEPVTVVCSASSWRAVEQQLPFQDATVPEKAVTFPAGSVIEFYNNSIHRPQTFYRHASEGNKGQERQIRLMMRACCFRRGFPPGAEPLNQIQTFTCVFIPNPGNAM